MHTAVLYDPVVAVDAMTRADSLFPDHLVDLMKEIFSDAPSCHSILVNPLVCKLMHETANLRRSGPQFPLVLPVSHSLCRLLVRVEFLYTISQWH